VRTAPLNSVESPIKPIQFTRRFQSGRLRPVCQHKGKVGGHTIMAGQVSGPAHRRRIATVSQPAFFALNGMKGEVDPIPALTQAAVGGKAEWVWFLPNLEDSGDLSKPERVSANLLILPSSSRRDSLCCNLVKRVSATPHANCALYRNLHP
jgi:hypothetical protein